jgi:AAA domain
MFAHSVVHFNTGKTFLGALVTRTIRRNADETILCVCYTNHALDQFLEHMLSSGERRLVRMGGRSKSDELEAYTLKNLTRHLQDGELDACQKRIRQVTAQMYGLKDAIDNSVASLLEPCSWYAIRTHLETDEPLLLSFLQVPVSNDGFKVVAPNGKDVDDELLWRAWKRGDHFPEWFRPHVAIPADFQHGFRCFWNMPFDERESSMRRWKRAIFQMEIVGILRDVHEFNDLATEKMTLSRGKEFNILKDARIIGATTSGAASYRDLLAMVSPSVVIVEEAGEVLEAHVLTALSTTSKHLIMIGDHKQLPPKVEQYRLTGTSGGGYKLDCSLFERLVLQRWPSVTLEVQHRMRPSISALIRQQTYPNLKDHESVRRYPSVRGVTDNVLFVNHAHLEDGEEAGDSRTKSRTKSNSFEAELTLEIVRYLLLQGYNASKIVVLTPYLGQLVHLVSLIKANLKEATAAVSERDKEEVELLDAADIGTDDENGYPTEAVRCSSIDNFQGEEADIIVVSLVRSNKQGTIGFLKEPQRVNVLLSRARHGLYIVGNSSTLMATTSGRLVWDPILRSLSERGRVVQGFPTICQRHPNDDPILLSAPGDFRSFRPNGGCNRRCTVRLECGHSCPLFCHSTDRAHVQARLLCCEPCKRFPKNCLNEHACPKLCKDACGRCMAFVGSTQLPCSHISKDIRCFEETEMETEKLIEMMLGRCSAKVSHTFLSCGHTTETNCANTRNTKLFCRALCQDQAKCGHPCSKR